MNLERGLLRCDCISIMDKTPRGATAKARCNTYSDNPDENKPRP